MVIFRKICADLATAAILLVISIVAVAAEPRWVSDSSSEYPSELYLVGRGAGSTAEEAQNRARGDLATIFEVRISVANTNNTTVAQSDNKEHVNKTISQQVSAKTDRTINGINIAEIWRDPVTQDFHALAVLSRAQASANLREEIANIDASLAQYIQSAKTFDDLLLKIGALTQSLQLSLKRAGLQSSLKVIDPAAEAVKSEFSPEQIQAEIDDALKKVRIAPEIIQDAGAKNFASAVKGGLAAAGFLTLSSDNADLILESKLTLTDLGKKDGWYWLRANVEVSLVEKVSRRVRGTKTWPVKTSAKDVKSANSRIQIDIEKLLKKELRPAIIGFAAS